MGAIMAISYKEQLQKTGIGSFPAEVLANPGSYGFSGATFNNLGTPSTFVSVGLKTNSSGINDGILRDSAGTIIPELVVNLIPRTDVLGAYGGTGLLSQVGGIGELASATDTKAIVQYSGSTNGGTVYYPYPIPTAVVTTIPANNKPGLFTANATYTIGTHFTTLDTAIVFLQQCYALENVKIILVLPPGRTAYITEPTKSLPWLFIQGSSINPSAVATTSYSMSGSTDATRKITFVLSYPVIDIGKFSVGQPVGLLHGSYRFGGVYLVDSLSSTTVTFKYVYATAVAGVPPGGVDSFGLYPNASWIESAPEISWFGGFTCVSFGGAAAGFGVGVVITKSKGGHFPYMENSLIFHDGVTFDGYANESLSNGGYLMTSSLNIVNGCNLTYVNDISIGSPDVSEITYPSSLYLNNNSSLIGPAPISLAGSSITMANCCKVCSESNIYLHNTPVSAFPNWLYITINSRLVSGLGVIVDATASKTTPAAGKAVPNVNSGTILANDGSVWYSV
jgi:hypothetical protein